jgi:hypothetical protein
VNVVTLKVSKNLILQAENVDVHMSLKISRCDFPKQC